MSRREYEVLAEVYNLLAKFEREEIQSASQLPGISRSIQAGLRALAQEAGRTQVTANRGVLRRKASNKSQRSPVALHSMDPLRLLLDRRHFPEKQDLTRLAEALGLSANIRPKASRERTARILAKEIERNDEAKRVLYEHLSASSQTEGWFDVIRRRSQ